MKTRKILFYLLMFLPLPVTLAALPFLPDRIPAHYGADNLVDRWGSKYESLLLPVMTVLFGLFMLGIAKYAARQEKTGQSNEKATLLGGIFALLLFNALTVYFLYTDFRQVEDLGSVPVDLMQLVFTLVGLMLIGVGNIAPKLRKNSVIGFRVPWSMKSERAWKKCQRFSGLVSILTGVLMIAACLFTRGFACMGLSLGILLIPLPVELFYAWRVARSEKNGPAEE